MRHLPDTFTLAADAQRTLAQLVAEPDFAHLRRHRLGCCYSERIILDRGAGTVALLLKPAQISSKQVERLFHEWALAQLFAPLFARELPDFIVFLDHTLWNGLAPLEREHVLFHELSHLRQTLTTFGAPRFEDNGRPALHIVRHDAELFTAEVTRYGGIAPGAEEIAVALADSARHARQRSA